MKNINISKGIIEITIVSWENILLYEIFHFNNFIHYTISVSQAISSVQGGPIKSPKFKN